MTSPPGNLQLVPHGPAARHALFALVRAHQRDDPLTPVTVAVPSPYAGLSLRRELGAEHGLLNVRFVALARVAELLGAPYLAEPDRRPLTPAIGRGAIRAALAQDAGDLSPVAAHPATVRSLATTFADLRALDDTALDRLEAGGGRAPTVVRLYRQTRALTRDYYDDEDQLSAATGVVASDGRAIADLGALILFLPRALSPAARRFVTAYVARAGGGAVLGLTGDPAVDDTTRALARDLSSALGEPHEEAASDPLAGDVVVSCPDADEEVRTVVREVVARVDAGEALHRIAIVYRNAEPYARLLHEHLTAGGIPMHGPSTRRLADSTAGRALLGLLALPDDDFRRDEVMDVLTSAPIVEAPGGRRVPGPRWDRLSCAANVVAGLEQWTRRLARHAEHRRERLMERANESGALFAADGTTDRVLDDCERLAAFITDLAAALEPPADASWPALSAWALALLDRYVGRTLPVAAPDAEHVALERVRAVVEGLAGLDALGTPPSVHALRASLDEELDTGVGHTGSYGDGVLIASVDALLGTDYDTVFVVGMNESSFPPPARDDPVLPDAERERIEGLLPGRAERRIRERATYLAALAAARRRVLSFPRADTRAQRAVRPAAWALETAAQRAGRLVGAQELDPGTAAAAAAVADGWLRIVASFDHAVRDTSTPASVGEHDLQSLLRWRGSHLRHPLVRAEPRLAAGLRATRARAGTSLDQWDGIIDPQLVVQLGDEATLSPTSLERWALCPFRYLLQQILRVEAVERPEARDRITGRDRGTLIHAVLEEFLHDHSPASATHHWTPEEREAIQALGARACDDAERDGLTGRPLLWRLDRVRVLRELDRFLETDQQLRADRELVPDAVEVAFGNPGDVHGPVRIELSNGSSVAFRGRIDRVDRTPDGFEVFDYKTGFRDLKEDALDADPVQAGTRLQLAIYALALRGDDITKTVRASYWFTREAGESALCGFTLDPSSEQRVRDVLDLVADEITAGHFPAYPGEDNWFRGPLNCQRCDYDRLCPGDRVRRFERRRDEPALDGILALREPDDELGEDADDAEDVG